MEFFTEKQEREPYWIRILSELYKEEKFRLEFEKHKNEANEPKKIFASIKISSRI